MLKEEMVRIVGDEKVKLVQGEKVAVYRWHDCRSDSDILVSLVDAAIIHWLVNNLGKKLVSSQLIYGRDCVVVGVMILSE